MCVFCQIVNKEIPAAVVFEDEEMMAFKDIHPAAPVHILIIPKKHISSLAETSTKDKELLGKLLDKARETGKEQGLAESGYKIIINTGPDGGQLVPHLHLHLLGGEKIGGKV